MFMRRLLARSDNGPIEDLVLVKIDKCYGTKVYRPINDVAKIFAEIAGTKTLTPKVIGRIKKLGFTVDTSIEMI